ncbi:hypothetical protein BK133_19980 [Paenibacillus sp. FSL H8-0548]|uniref:sugar phosphate isomerase/epimerase family protein n=1 Tax=Paenibacillus sp. FSL H8-0548 TaxID=1920422 RepID=UPI00096C7369|nr:TIM barrel protein [Paenibacillus sp. FSL H8-0548]OMF26723.1 hypothetical protein BK133_19980 [Paenibacillus sp. FSL H8-0548]
MTIPFGFQTYTWQMSYEKYRDQLDHILTTVTEAGGAGIEPEVCMLGRYTDTPLALLDELDRKGLRLSALCLALEWRHGEETEEERAEADRIIRYLKYFPGTILTLVQLPGKDRSDLVNRQSNALSNINAVAQRAFDQGIPCAYHPNSPSGSIFRVEEDYSVLLNGLDGRYCGYAPDTGHIAKGGMDVEAIIKTYRSMIKHVHFKDMNADGSWTALGQGIIDHKGIVRFLNGTGYDGWIMVEEESKGAESDPDQVTLQNGIYIREALAPLGR